MAVRLRGSGLDVDDGLSLVEVIVAITLFALVAAAAGAMLITGVGVSRDSRNRTVASQLASAQLELARKTATTAFTTLTAPAAPTVTTVNSVAFSVAQTAVFIPKNAPAGACAGTGQGGDTGVQPVLLVTETVTWPRMDRTAPVTVSTTLTPPVGAYPDGSGAMNIKVTDRNNVGVANVALTASGATPTSMTTDSYGCAFAAFLTPGNYNVTASTNGYVDNQEQATSTQVVGVVDGQTAATTFYYDRAAEVDVVLDRTVPPATGLPVSVSNSGLAGTGYFSFPAGVTQLKPLYPYSSYGVWAGRCPENSPAAVDAGNNPLYPGASTTIVTPVGGQAVNSPVPLYPLTVQVNRMFFGFFNLGGVNGVTMTATETGGAARTLCGGPYSTFGLSTTQRVGATDGVSVTGLPLGTYTVKATYNGVSATQTIVVRPAGTNATMGLIY